MTLQELTNRYKNLVRRIDNGQMKEAFDLLTHFITVTGQHAFTSRVEELQNTYRYMLHYYVEGSNDPTRHRIRADIRRRAYELADAVRHATFGDISPATYYSVRRSVRYAGIGITSILRQVALYAEAGDREHGEPAANRLFDALWTTEFIDADTASAIREALCSRSFPTDVKTLLVSALLLGLQASFDREKMRLLFDAAALSDADTVNVSLQALVAICLTLYTYSTRLDLYPEVQERLEMLAEMPDFRRRLSSVIVRFILTRETEKVAHRLKDEILPEIMKLTTQGGKGPTTDFLKEIAGEEMNPEWMERMVGRSDKLSAWMREYGELQEEGIDLLHTTFGPLKRFPFFYETGNWFLPFTPRHTALRDRNGDGFVDGILGLAAFMCDSDKYSFCFSMLHLPDMQRRALGEQLRGDLTQLREQEAAELGDRSKHEERLIGLYIRNLYRFYKLHPGRGDFDDIFNCGLDFHRLPILRPYLSDAETLLRIAEVYLRKGYPDDARPIYEELLQRGEGDSEMLHQKLGYCLQSIGDVDGALREYLRAELINPDSKWLLRRIAACYRALKQPARALEFLLRHERLEPDNLSVLLHIGHCYLEQKMYDEALKYYFKVDYLDPTNAKGGRGVAWCSFVLRKYDQARATYRKLLADRPQPEDYLNAGHTEWASGHVKEAYAYYLQAAAGKDFGFFANLFDADRSALIRAGIDLEEIALMRDEMQFVLPAEEMHPDH